MRISTREGLLISALLLGFAAPSSAPMNRCIVHAAEGAGLDHCGSVVTSLGGQLRKPLGLINAVACELPQDTIHALAASETVALVEPDIKIHTQCFFRRRRKHPDQVLTWGIRRIETEKAWSVTRGETTRVAVIDTGVDLSHPDLKGQIAGGTNTIEPASSCQDDNGHGTLVAGVIAASDNEIGVVGVAPRAHLYAAKALNRHGEGYLSDVIEALEWSLQQEVQIINLSLGTPEATVSFEKAVKAAWDAGVVLVAAAGNSGPKEATVHYPAAFAEVIAVGAVDSSDTVPDFSSRGPELDLVAPGVDVYSTHLNNAYTQSTGTSLAAPFVSGTALLFASVSPGDSAEQLRRRLTASGTLLPNNPGSAQGNGLVSAAAVAS